MSYLCTSSSLHVYILNNVSLPLRLPSGVNYDIKQLLQHTDMKVARFPWVILSMIAHFCPPFNKIQNKMKYPFFSIDLCYRYH